MKVAVIGANIFEKTVSRGYDSIDISRNPSKELPKGKCTYVSVDIFNLHELENALKGVEIAVHVYCQPKNSTFEKMEELQVNSTKNIIEAAKKVDARRLLAVGGAGTLITNGTRNMDFPPAYMLNCLHLFWSKRLFQEQYYAHQWKFIQVKNKVSLG